MNVRSVMVVVWDVPELIQLQEETQLHPSQLHEVACLSRLITRHVEAMMVQDIEENKGMGTMLRRGVHH